MIQELIKIDLQENQKNLAQKKKSYQPKAAYGKEWKKNKNKKD
jgi:hypothetical protein